MRFSLRWLMLAVAYAALICAASVYRSPLLGSAVLTLTLVIAFGATVAAWRTDPERSFYGPMAVAMWLYFVVLFYEPVGKLERSLPTTHVVFRIWAWANTEQPNPSWAYWHDHYFSSRHVLYSTEQFSQLIGALNVFYFTIHCASALLLGLLAGGLTVWVERKHKG